MQFIMPCTNRKWMCYANTILKEWKTKIGMTFSNEFHWDETEKIALKIPRIIQESNGYEPCNGNQCKMYKLK